MKIRPANWPLSQPFRQALGLAAGLVLFLAGSAAPLAASQVSPPQEAEPDGSARLAQLVGEALAVVVPTRSGEEYRRAAETYRRLGTELREIDRSALGLDDQVDYDLLEGRLSTRRFEIEDARLHELVPVLYLSLPITDSLFLRPCSQPDPVVRRAVGKLETLPEILSNAKLNLTRPAREWTENALYQVFYVRQLLVEEVPGVCVDDPAVALELAEAARGALAAVDDFETWMREVLLPRSDRPPTWTVEQIEHYQFIHERLTGYSVAEMLRIAEAEEARLLEEMAALARRIHPSGDLRRVWEIMKEEAPPWPEVLPMAQRYVELASTWLHGPGSHLVTIPETMDYGARLTPPMARRILSFGGAYYGPTVAGRISGYYVLTPLEDSLTPEERRSRLKSYNPYWTCVISYHEWLGHNVQRAHAELGALRPIRAAYGSIYLSQAWSFYLEELLEDEGFYETLPYMEELKTRMARRQMRMWRVQRILTKLKMARGEMSFDEAVAAYVEKIGMEPTNAFIEVQRDSQSPSPPGREIIGEKALLELRAEAERRLGEHYRMKAFHDSLLSHGELPLPILRRLMFGD